MITENINPPALTLCAVLPFVANGAHAVSISAGAVAAAERVYALRDGDVALGSFPAAVTHTGALVVLAVAAAQHRARRWRSRGKRRREVEIKPCAWGKERKKKKTINRPFLEILKAAKRHAAHPRASTHTPPCGRVNRVVKRLESANDIKSNYRQR